jgi:hypothetical protein
LSSDLQCTERHTAEVDGFDLFHAQKGEVIDICAVGCEQEVPDSVEQPQGEKLGALIWREECLAR